MWSCDRPQLQSINYLRMWYSRSFSLASFGWLDDSQLAVIFSHINSVSATSQPAIFFSHNKSASATSQPNEAYIDRLYYLLYVTWHLRLTRSGLNYYPWSDVRLERSAVRATCFCGFPAEAMFRYQSLSTKFTVQNSYSTSHQKTDTYMEY
jgi:hypothetical protein